MADPAENNPLLEAITRQILAEPRLRDHLTSQAIRDTAERLLIPGLMIMTVAAVSGISLIIGAQHSAFYQCCVPQQCNTVGGLNGSFPGFSALGDHVCTLSPAQAAAMNCPEPNLTSQLLNTYDCQMLVGDCTTNTRQMVDVMAASSLMVAGMIAFTLIVALLMRDYDGRWLWLCSRMLFACVVVAAALVGVAAAIMAAVMGGMLKENIGLRDNGVSGIGESHNGENVPNTFISCFNQTGARTISYVSLTNEATTSQVGIYLAVGAFPIFLAASGIMVIRRYRYIRTVVIARVLQEL
jgi:hypothetical protein